jgi:hypothetical protein
VSDTSLHHEQFWLILKKLDADKVSTIFNKWVSTKVLRDEVLKQFILVMVCLPTPVQVLTANTIHTVFFFKKKKRPSMHCTALCRLKDSSLYHVYRFSACRALRHNLFFFKKRMLCSSGRYLHCCSLMRGPPFCAN